MATPQQSQNDQKFENSGDFLPHSRPHADKDDGERNEQSYLDARIEGEQA